MSPQLHRRVRELFDLALEQPEAERLAFVESVCGGESDVFDALIRLLDAHRGARSFLQENAARPQSIGRYVIVGELGRGTMGIVYEATDPLIGRNIAVKVIHLDALTDVSGTPSSLDRVFREARSAGSLLHPGIVIVFDVGQESNTVFFAMEKVDGPSLDQELASGRKIEPVEALDIVRQIALALDYAHQHGVVHRDIKPANILLAGGATVKVADFSIAKIVSAQSLTATGMVWGTPNYMSPEQIEGRPLDGRSDQFALAVLAYELLTGAKPFQADSLVALAHVIVHAPRPSARAANPALLPAVDQVFYRGLARFHEERFVSCEEFAAALKKAAGSLPVRDDRAVPLDPIHTGTRWKGQFRYVAGGAAGVVVLFGSVLLHQFVTPAEKREKAPVTPSLAKKAQAPVVTRVLAKPISTTFAKSAASKPKEPETEIADPAPPSVDPAAQARQLYEQAVAQEDMGLMRRAAEMGVSQAMVAMGEMHADNDDEKEALEWFRKAADAGNAAGMVHLGFIYQLGDGVAQDDRTAAYWYEKASDAGDPSAMFDLGALYEYGQGVHENLAKAAELYRRAAEKGSGEARTALARLKGN